MNTYSLLLKAIFFKISLAIIILIGIYFGFAGICRLKLEEDLSRLESKKEQLSKVTVKRSFNDVPFTDEYSYEYFVTLSEYRNIFPWIEAIPSIIGMLFTSMAFGLLGSITGILYDIIKSEVEIHNLKIMSKSLLGMFIGLAVLGLSYVLPNLLVIESGSVRPIALMFFAFFSGIYSEKFFEILLSIFLKLFKS